jgi:hypothetical protein
MWTGLPECTGAQVVLAKDGWSEDRWSGPLIRAKRGMRCIITVEVHNASGGSVHLEGAQLPLMGPGGGNVIKVDMGTTPELWEVLSRLDDIDLVRPLNVTLQPGEKTTFDIPVVFRDRGCTGGAGGRGRAYIHGFPVVTVKTLLYSFEQSAVNDLAFSQNSPSSGCSRI